MNKLERFDALADRYIRMAKRNNLTTASVKNYENTMKNLRDFLQKQDKQAIMDSDEYVTFDDIQAWIDNMAENGNKASTIKQKLVVAGQFFTFCTKPYIPEELRYDQSPVSPDFYPKVPTEQIEEKLSNDDIMKLWLYEPKYRATDAQWARNYCMVVLMLTTGLRNKEVLDLTLDSIDMIHKEILVKNGKGRKDRIVDMDIGGLCAAALENYLLIGDRPRSLPDSAPLFGTTAEHVYGQPGRAQDAEKWHRGTTQWLSQLVARHVENQTSGAVVGCRTHQLRHAFARLQLNATGNLAELQAAMGHASPVVTERYSNRLVERRRREEVLKVLAARDSAAKSLQWRNELTKQKTEQSKIRYA